MAVPRSISPHTVTILCTYQCTAACRQCCFESSPSVRGRLDRDTVISRIAEAKASFPDLRLVVFSGGEAMILKEDLYIAIDHCSAEGLLSRVVSNGYWGKSSRSARSSAEKLRDAGLRELNISTGRDHLEWVPLESVVNAAVAAADAGIFCLITVESECSGKRIIDQLTASERLAPLIQQRRVSLQSNSWMPFNDTADDRRPQIDIAEMRKGCEQILGTVVLTPHDNLSACCGLALEHIPEMRLGRCDGSNMSDLYLEQLKDFLKLWIRVDGPYSIIERLMGSEAERILAGVVHVCEACLRLHKSPEVREALALRYQEFVPEILTRFKVDLAVRERITSTRRGTGNA